MSSTTPPDSPIADDRRRHQAGVVRELEEVMASVDRDQLPEMLGALERIRGRALARLMSPPPPAPVVDELLTIPDVAKRLSISVQHAYTLCRRGDLPTVTVGEKFVRVRTSALNDWIRRREAGGREDR